MFPSDDTDTNLLSECSAAVLALDTICIASQIERSFAEMELLSFLA
jgi:hypothetical protein